MKKLLSLLLAATMVFALSACGAQEVDTDSIVIWHDKEDAVAEVLQNYLNEALPELNITLEKKTSLTDSLKLVGNDPSSAPDMFIFAHDKIGVFAEMGILAPIEELLPEGELANYLEMTTEAATYKGTVYQLPLYFETLLFMYNRRYMTDDMVPSTTEELYSYMEANTGRDRYGFVEQHSTAYYSAAWIHGFGGEIISADGVPFPDADAVKEALRYHLKFVQLMPGETEYSTVNTLFLEGKADSTIGGPWMVPSARDAGIDLGIAPMPTVDETGEPLAPYSGVQGVHVLTFAAEDKPDSVKAVLEALCAPEVGIELALASGCAPARAECYDDESVANDELVQAMRSTAEIAVPMPNIPEMDVMWTVMSTLLTDVNLSGRDVDESFDSALSNAESLIANMQ
ncbi:MAG TPA: extracellular solute-binding protein [Candidatus Scatomorpha intestinavium]|uniref:Extracellular solute-binding protein n=1 Tax=Candidatus Scatomorpha intestinavium TaxID=2840922 RepID=A0A9D0ZE15_9FIRM|nr:extracellular solute-binding protein [Candidatus Scatomorpha intestinavium]